MRHRKAVILAAGAGSRLSPGGQGVPKPLVPLSGEPGTTTLLDRHVRCLHAAGVGEIFVVGNVATYGTVVAAAEGADVRWILNDTPRPGDTGSGHSAWLAFIGPYEILDGKSDVLLMDADIAYGSALLPAVLASDDGGHSRIVVTTETPPNDDAVLIYVDGTGVPKMQGKHLAGTQQVLGLQLAGVATGILVWHPADHEALRTVADWVIRWSTARARSEHEDITQQMIDLGRMRLVEVPPECPFIEVDTPADYLDLTARVWPLLAAERI